MSKILTVDVEKRFHEFLKSLEKAEIYSCDIEKMAKTASETDFDVIIINAPENSSWEKSVVYLSEKTTAGIMVICSEEKFSEISQTMSPEGICVIAGTTECSVFLNSVCILCITHARMNAITHKYNKLQLQIEETRLINRAKCILIQYLKFTEPQAHRYIEKQAMDTRQSKADVARNILMTYES